MARASGRGDPLLGRSREDDVSPSEAFVRKVSKQVGGLTPVITSPFTRTRANSINTLRNRWLRRQVALSCVIMFAEGYYATQLFPYGPSMVTRLRGSKENIGTLTGVLYTAQSLGMLATSYFWAKMSNKYGRRFCLLIGLASNVFATGCIALSTSYEVTVFFRFFTGLMNSNLSIMRTALREAFQHEDAEDTWAFSTLTVAFGASSVLGPSLGGLLYGLELPAVGNWQLPWTLATLTCTMLYAICLCATALFLPETAFLHRPIVAANDGAGESPESGRGLVQDLSFILILVMGGGHSYVFTGWELVYPLIARLPSEDEGEAWSAAQIGVTFLVGSAGLVLYSLVLFPKIAKRVPLVRLWLWQILLPLVAMAGFPQLLTNACVQRLSQAWFAVLNYGTQLLISVFWGSGFITIQLILNEYVTKKPDSKSALAIANSGLVSTQALVRAASPLVTGGLFTLGLSSEDSASHLLDRSLPFYHLAAAGAVFCGLCGYLYERRP
eukprot:TRINITY_DN46603_c0_g1_i1.p1 TRINITY_DN46603_c0_g1~~TRINITY_DN46603_c0_g1_i1.p1  ORF type:complete len:511 (+),score=77.68 TRINITY_DN46603_c0_g1_i1:40-1533(+)